MSGGYDQFFKQAQKAKGLSNSGGTKFKLKPESKPSVRSSETPEDRLRQELAKRIREKKRMAIKRKKFPLYPLISATVAFGLCALAYQYSDHLDHWLGKIEVGIFGSAQAADAPAAEKPATADPAAKKSPSAPESAAKSADAKASSVSSGDSESKQWSSEEISFFSKLNERKRELDLREAELAKLEEELQKRKDELDEKIKTLEAMRSEISKTLQSRVSEDQSRVEKLVQVYSGMKPAQAAKVIETLNEDLAVEVLDKMKKKSASEILDMMDAKKARRLSELLTGYQRSPASARAEEGAEN